jgi:hypothetical protein
MPVSGIEMRTSPRSPVRSRSAVGEVVGRHHRLAHGDQDLACDLAVRIGYLVDSGEVSVF